MYFAFVLLISFFKFRLLDDTVNMYIAIGLNLLRVYFI